ncbi:hypothetical protein R1flu_013316 [Riccia fluitans]|uniref:Uncharacterized protein n=1 Tax=Riccia fluitans TaxID=41844 RepID=A0ABD1YDN7_9MARC
MGGVGKTTLAGALFDAMKKDFAYTCFVGVEEYFREVNPSSVREMIFKNMKRWGREVNSTDWTVLERKRVLFVLDDVDSDTLGQLLIYAETFAQGSCVLGTSRIRSSFDLNGSALSFDRYELQPMGEQDSLTLFNRCAFRAKESPPELQSKLEQVVRYCGGLPYSLQLIGKYLQGKPENAWDNFLQVFQGSRIPGEEEHIIEEMLEKLKASFNSLAELEQKMFLDLAVDYAGNDLEETLTVLRGKYPGVADSGWANLLNKSLVSVAYSAPAETPHRRLQAIVPTLGEGGVISMHEHVRLLGRRLSQYSGRATADPRKTYNLHVNVYSPKPELSHEKHNQRPILGPEKSLPVESKSTSQVGISSKGRDIPTKYPRILVATAYDVYENSKILTSYVAFKGSSGLEKTIFDVAGSKLQHHGPEDKSLPMKGHIHNGIYKELVEELPDPMELLTFCDRMASDPKTPEHDQRCLIFCGHGLGGALSHAAMLNLLFTTFGTDTKGMMECGSTCLSIAFGAPLFLDKQARDYFSEKGEVPLASRFMTYINEDDPVPLMLNELLGSPMAALQELRKQLNLDFQSVFEFAGKVPLSLDPKDRRQGSTGEPSALLKRGLEKIAVNIEALKKLPSQHGRAYAGFGQFFKLLDGETCGEIPQSDPAFWTLRWTPKCVKNHAMVSYALSDLHPPLYGVPSLRSIQGGKPPQINRANYTLIFGKKLGEVTQIRLEAVGYNLDLCVKERCQVSAFRNKWEIMMVSHEKIMFRNKTKLKETEIKVIEYGISVKIETIFGESDWVRVEKSEPAAGSDIINGLKYVIGKIVILRSVQDRIHVHPSSGSIDRFREHLQLVAENSCASEGDQCNCAEDSLKMFYSGLGNSANRVFDQRIEGKHFIDKVAQHLNQANLEVKLTPYIGEGETRRFRVRKVGSGAGFGIFSAGVGLNIYNAVAALVSVATMAIDLPIAAGGLLINNAARFLSHRRTVKIEGYSHVLRFICHAINPEKSVLPPEKNVADYERAIIHCAEIISKENSNAWIDHLNEQLKEQNLTTRERVKNLVEVMLATDKSVKLAKEEKMLAVVGLENAGKSTLINILINGPPKDDEEDQDKATTGISSHTYDPKGYLALAVGNLVAVDFPGMQAAEWEAFERLPDVCVVMLRFSGDVTADCGELPRLARKKLCKRVVLIVNQVDFVMKGPKTAPVWKEFSPDRMNELREAYKRKCDNMLDDVMLTCLSSQDLFNKEKELLRARGILFAEDVLKKIKQLVQK